MVKETQMNKDAYDGCSCGKDGVNYELTIGLFEDTNALTFTKDEWEAFKEFGDELFEDSEGITLIKERLKETGRPITLEELMDL